MVMLAVVVIVVAGRDAARNTAIEGKDNCRGHTSGECE